MAMTILHAGGTADTGELINGAYESTDYAIAGASRGCIYTENNQYYRIRARDPATGLATSFTKGWVHFVYQPGYSTGNNPNTLNFLDSTGQSVIRGVVSNEARSYTLIYQYWNGSTWNALPGLTYQVLGSTVMTVDYMIDTVAGRIEVYQNGVLMTAADLPQIVGMAIAMVQFGNSYDRYMYQQTLIATGEPTIGCSVRTRYATGQGEDSAWTGTFADVDEYPYNDSDYITAANVGDKESFIANDLPALPVGNEVKGVVIAARFRNNGGTPGNIRPYLFIGGVQYPANNFPDATVGWTAGVTVFSNNPATGTAWGKDINTVNVQFGVEATQ